MPHAVILKATEFPELGREPLSSKGGVIHKVLETAASKAGLLVKSLVIDAGKPLHFYCRIDLREDGLLVRMDDHIPIARSDALFDHLALIAKRVLEANPGSTLGKTNLEVRIRGLNDDPARPR